MAVLDTLTADMKTAMRARDKERLSTIRLLISELKNEKIRKRSDLTESEEIDVLAREAKRRAESVEAYEKGGRQDLSEKEQAELVIIKEYLPQQLTPDEVLDMLKATIAEVGASSMSDMGKVMGKVMPKLRGRFPGKEVRPLLQTLLS